MPWLKKVPPRHRCWLPSVDDKGTKAAGSLWKCRVKYRLPNGEKVRCGRVWRLVKIRVDTGDWECIEDPNRETMNDL